MPEEGYLKLMETLFGNLPYGAYAYIVDQKGNKTTLEEAVNGTLKIFPKSRVLELSFGINGQQKHTDETIASILKIRRSQSVSQMRVQALSKLRGSFVKESGLRKFIIPSSEDNWEMPEAEDTADTRKEGFRFLRQAAEIAFAQENLRNDPRVLNLLLRNYKTWGIKRLRAIATHQGRRGKVKLMYGMGPLVAETAKEILEIAEGLQAGES